jgi:DNA-binding HxlR family transcriptional regulator
MRWQQIDKMNCSIARTLSVVGDRWTLLIIRDVFLGISRFDPIQQDLQLTPHRLSDRLRKLVRDGILRRAAYEKRPPRFEYRLTEKGFDLYPVIVTMLEWGDRWMAGPSGAPVALVHQPCGHSIKPELICPACKLKIEAREMKAELGPGSREPGGRAKGPAKRRNAAGRTQKTA